MTIRILRPTTPTLTQALDGDGELHVFVPADVEVERDGVRDVRESAIALRWEGAPRDARLTQQVSVRTFLATYAADYVPLEPDAPYTDTTVQFGAGASRSGQPLYLEGRIPLSPPEGLRRWTLDAAPTSNGRCPAGRGYVSDESYEFTDRERSTLVFYDRPSLGLRDVVTAIRRASLSPSDYSAYELVALFHTELLRGSRRLGVVLWSCSWRHSIGSFGALMDGTRRFDRPSDREGLAAFYVQPPVGPTPHERRRMLFEWRDGRRRCPQLTPMQRQR
jgi:hypothetical protein